MADEQTPVGPAPTETPGAGAAPAASAPTEATPKEGESQTGNEPSGNDKKPEGTNDPSKPQDDEEPPVRKTKLDFILERKQRQLEKAKASQIKNIDQELKKLDGGAQDQDGAENEDDIPAEDAEVVEKVVEKKFGSYFKEMDQQKEAAEMQSFLAENPEFKPYEARIKKYAGHESRRHLPLKAIAYEVAGPDLMRIGAEKAKKADQEAAKSTTGGGTTRSEPSHKPISEMTKEEFRDFSEKVRRGEVALK